MNLFLQNLSLRKKIIMTSIACLILPTLIMLYITNVFSQRIIREHTLESANQTLQNVQTQINKVIDEMVAVSNMIQFDSELKSLLQGTSGPLVSKAVTTKLEQLVNDKPDMKLTLLMMDGRYYSSYSYYEFEPTDFRKQSWLGELSHYSALDTLFIGVQPNYIKSQAEENPYVIMTARVLTDSSSNPIAYLIVSRTETTFSHIFDKFSEEIFLLDPNSRILSHRDKMYIGDDFKHLIQKGIIESPETISLHGQTHLHVAVPLRHAGWTLVSLAPYEQLTDRLNNISRSGLVLQVLFVVGFIFILAYLLRKFTKPIQVLGQVALKVEAGDIEIRSNIRGRDEVGRLGRAFDQMLDRIIQMLEQVKLEQELKRQAEIAMLHAQIHPHFLFNVLSSIRLKLLMKDDHENAELIGSLSTLLRSTISTQQEFVSLVAEIEMAKQYMDLMNFTTRHPVVSRIQLNSELLLETVPRFILQPIIENAYKHGFSRKSGCITIHVDQVEESLLISLTDNGLGMDSETLGQLKESLLLNKRQIIEESTHHGSKPISGGIGLSNVYERLKLIYGERFQMTIESELNQGTTILFMIPIKNGE
ncbi:two-component system, sensor histidine kinase YesM [Paenibacillus sp. 1_12]|uniref:cache domain-containing sensor histidine kinase n=1 Tax=Paenibacillus sp. 1_12 TaxID=1566278 RepID=UPI0008E7CA99|nr:sensor histidine kinase [Paenibacillus sp. 1_12]SFK78831.1 two-component system, sensor histidine kinase YesM [Paenibacillus sp. 1_12]